MKTMIDIYKNSNLEEHEKGILAFGISKAYEDLTTLKCLIHILKMQIN